MPDTAINPEVDRERIDAECFRILRRLSEQGAVLALAPVMETAVVVRSGSDGATIRTAMVDREIAEALVLRQWIETAGEGKVLRYVITQAGRAALRDKLAQDECRHLGDAGSDASKAEQPGQGQRRRTGKYTAVESPLTALARRKDLQGRPFLTRELVAAGERLREDYELSQITPEPWQNDSAANNPASDRVAAALEALGPGLADVALRCCCRLEGLERAERQMGWSARSAKIVLRIALQQLLRHYELHGEEWSPLIG